MRRRMMLKVVFSLKAIIKFLLCIVYIHSHC